MATINDLICALEEMAEAYGEDAEVRLMTQENWPFENTITGIVTSKDMNRAEEAEGRECGYDFPSCSECPEREACEDAKGDHGGEIENDDEDEQVVIYLVEGRQLGYGNKAAWEACQPL